MTQASISKLEAFGPFLRRIVELNRLYNPDDPLHADILADDHNGMEKPADGTYTEAGWARKKLVTMHREFPYGAPIAEQAAFLSRAFLGLAPFAEANHRTGWDYLGELLEHQGRQLFASVDDGRALAADLDERMALVYPNGLQRSQVNDRDEVFDYLADWYRHRVG